MSRARASTYIALALTVATAGGCFKLARTSPAVERYVLGGARIEAAATESANGAGLSIGIRRLDLAPYLASLAIVVRRADNEIVTTGFHRWAESPRSGLNRAVSGYLAASPGIRSVDVAPWPIRSDHDYLVQLHVARLEGVAPGGARASDGGAHLSAHWEVIRATDDALVARGTTEHRTTGWTAGDYAALVAQLDQGLVVLARELVSCLTRLGPVAADSAANGAGRAAVLECGGR